MVEIGVCIEPFFGDIPYKERIEKIASIGFKYYEFWFHNAGFDGKNLTDEKKDFDMIAELNYKLGLTTTCFVHCHPDGGIKASLINKDDRGLILNSLTEEIIPLAKKIGCKGLISGSGNVNPFISEKEAIENIVETLIQISKIVEKEDITLLLEPWNTKVDHPLNFLSDPQMAVNIIKDVNHKNIKLLYDIYHMQIMKGDIVRFIRENIQYIGHFHIAGVPGRKEPIDNELYYPFIIKESVAAGYKGVFGLEYWPTMPSEKSLEKVLEYLTGVAV